jgi:hypothetical protein
MALVILLLCFSALCWALLLLSWKGRLTRRPEEKRVANHRRSAEVVELQRERWRRRQGRPYRAASKTR